MSSSKSGKSKTSATELTAACGLKNVTPSYENFQRIGGVTPKDALMASNWIANPKNNDVHQHMILAGTMLRSHIKDASLVSWEGGVRTNSADIPRDLRAGEHLISIKADSDYLLNSGAATWNYLLGKRGPSIHAFEKWAKPEYDALINACSNTRIQTVEDFKLLYPSIKEQQEFGKVMASSGNEEYRKMTRATSENAQIFFKDALSTPGVVQDFFFKAFRIYQSPYFICGIENKKPFAVKICTIDDWLKRFTIRSWNVRQRFSKQCEVHFDFFIDDALGKKDIPYTLIMEIRWSHGKFSGNPECKIKKDFEHRDAPWATVL